MSVGFMFTKSGKFVEVCSLLLNISCHAETWLNDAETPVGPGVGWTGATLLQLDANEKSLLPAPSLPSPFCPMCASSSSLDEAFMESPVELMDRGWAGWL